MSNKNKFISHLKHKYPTLSNISFEDKISDNLISPFKAELRESSLTQIKHFISAVFKMRESKNYLNHYEVDLKKQNLIDPENKSIMMSYDFHIDENGTPKLIEINTNASFLLLGLELYEALNQEKPVPHFSTKNIAEMLRSELKYHEKSEKQNPSISIIDESPSEQRLYVEFIVANEMFKSLGFNSQIQDYREITSATAPDLIYNRYTDFFLTDPTSQELRKIYENKLSVVTPNPFEYFLLADKQRMIDWHQMGFMDNLDLTPAEKDLILKITPLAKDLTSETAPEIWSQKKKYFLKPKNSFGSKQSYRGGSISTKLFETLIDQNMIAQEFIPAPEKDFAINESETTKLKYDLRCYAYKGELQLIVARLYQGQVTNLQTPHGGFATVSITN